MTDTAERLDLVFDGNEHEFWHPEFFTKLALPEDFPELTVEEMEQLPEHLLVEYLAELRQIIDRGVLTKPQQKAHDLSLVVDEVMYGGAAGPGKSHYAVWHADYCSKRWPGHRTLCLRESLPELRRTLIGKSFEMIDTDQAKWRAADKEWRYHNGSIIEFGYCATFDDVRQFLSAEYDLIVIDESTSMTKDMIEMLRSRLRTSKVKRDAGVNPHLMLLTNPGGPSHEWHRTRYVDPTNHGEFVVDIDERDEKGRGRHRSIAYVRALVGDNPFIDPDYISNLVAIDDPVRRAQYLDGDWSVFEGQYFQEWDYDLHTCEPFEIPESWPKIGGYDWGYAAASCLLLGAVDPDKRIHIYWELYEERLTAAEQGRLFDKLKPSLRPTFIAADPSIWRNTGVGVPIARQLTEAGIKPLRKASNARVDGWSRMRQFLACDDNGVPGMVIHRNCENLIRTLPLMQRDKNNPEDLDTRSEDHAVDACRYLLSTRTRHPSEKKRGPQTYDERVMQYVKKRAGAKSRRPVHDVLGKL